MTQQEYEQKREQEWRAFCNRHGIIDRGHVILFSAFFDAFDRAYALSKQEKDADTVTINKGEYYKLCKCSRYMANWVPYFDVCPICGEYNQRGCICINCDNDKNLNNG